MFSLSLYNFCSFLAVEPFSVPSCVCKSVSVCVLQACKHTRAPTNTHTQALQRVFHALVLVCELDSISIESTHTSKLSVSGEGRGGERRKLNKIINKIERERGSEHSGKMRINSVPVARGVYAICEPASSGALCVCPSVLVCITYFQKGVCMCVCVGT